MSETERKLNAYRYAIQSVAAHMQNKDNRCASAIDALMYLGDELVTLEFYRNKEKKTEAAVNESTD